LEGEDFLEGFSIQYHRNDWQFETGHGWLWRVPDFPENMQEGRQILTMKYSNNITSKISQEYVLLYQERTIDWKVRFAERGAYEDFYPDGNWEILNTNANNIFGRSQWAYDIGQGGNILVGMEANVFRYKNDRKHFSDVDYSNAEDEFPPYENGALTPQGPWLEWIAGEPVPSFAAYAQLVSGRFWNRSLELTLGIRYDETYAKYKAIDEPFGRIVDEIPFTPIERRVFRRTNPRAGLVYFASEKLSFKAMGGTAFRAPSITEMFGANTFTLASNPRELKPEIITTYDIGMDWIFWKYFNFRANWFWTKFENQIAYSIQNNNLSTNIYDLVTRGVESELLITYKQFSAFINYSWNQRMNEKIYDETIAESQRETAWAPARTGNIGFRQHINQFMYSLSMQYQGRVKRRISDQDVYDPETGELENPFYQYNYPRYRPDSIDPWVQMNLKLSYYFTDKMSLGLFVSNALNQEQQLIKNNLYAFDYRRENRRFLVDFSASF
jgi:outer membrane receptor protein involved in Fe transport